LRFAFAVERQCTALRRKRETQAAGTATMSITTPITALARAVRAAAGAALDVHRIREDFPILKQRVHGKPLVYLDNAATAQKPRSVIETLRRYYESDNANVHRAVHLLSERATEAYEEARVKAQKFIHAHCLREIIFTRGTTEAINLVAHSFGRTHVHEGDEVLITALEHHSNIVPWQLLCWEKKAKLQVAPVNDAGELELDAFERLLSPRTRLVAVAHISNALGTILPVKEIIALAHRRGIPVLVDGAQAAPHQPIDVADLDCDFYTFSGHKVYGPTGIGVLYGKARRLELMPPWQGGGDMISSVSFEKTTWNELPYKFEAGTPDIAGAIGLCAALEYVEDVGREAIALHEHRLLEHATARLNAIAGVRVIGTAAQKAAVLSFVVDDPPLATLDIGTRLDLEGIAVRTGHHCCQPLMDRFAIPGTVRASLAMYNTLEETDRFADVLEKIVKAARGKVPIVSLPSTPTSLVFPAAAAPTPDQAAQDLVESFDVMDDWNDRYHYLIELGEKLPPMPAELKTETTRIHGCQSTVHMFARKQPGTADVLEFLADSDADIVRGELALLQRVYSGQRAPLVLAFDEQAFLRRLGLEKNLTWQRRNGLAEMIKRVRHYAGDLANKQIAPASVEA
jgi:cysteine desulfurase/selenocysteine lyase